ncbi:hypothetical protein [Bradyrhizobium betae]|uniref:Uncharacterized protein n=1 Tax=Bradyrhizobium betae TaxID=244734 RepID=A0A4V1P674_9BRAD|nr:hypothetical protein [Bradyrhizobium betae]RXT46619.1 hypothetical protein B5V03_16975 [Bradyrhizobium betae]
MDKQRSRQPPDGTRARRRSLVELTAVVSRTIDEGLLEMRATPVGVPQHDGPRSEQAGKIPASEVPDHEASARMTPAETAPPAALDGIVEAPSSTKGALSSTQSQNSGSTIDLAAEIAKDMQAHALEAMKVGMHAALDYAKDFTSPDSDLQKGPAAECHAVALELMKVNAGATLQYTRELNRAKTLSEWIELSSAHARKQCELVLQQAELLKSLTRKVTTSGAE